MAWAGGVFWPHAADDLFGYAFFPNGAGARFWAHGDILSDVFIDRAALAGGHARAPADGKIAAAAETDGRATRPPFELCGSAGGSSGAQGMIERIEQAVAPSQAQREPLAQLHTAMVEASERLEAVCPAGAPADPPQRLDAMQERIWALRDAMLTLRVPLENFYNALSDEQKARLYGSDADAIAPQTTRGRAAPNCGGQIAGLGNRQAIERLIKPTREQRARLQALQMRFAGLAQLVIGSCPGKTPASPLDRLAAAGERLTAMLFAVMSAGPELQAFYDSLSDQQKAEIGRSLRPRAGQGA